MCCKKNNNPSMQERLAHFEIITKLDEVLDRLDDIELFIAEIACLCEDENDECGTCSEDESSASCSYKTGNQRQGIETCEPCCNNDE